MSQQRPLADYDGLAAYPNITHRHAEDHRAPDCSGEQPMSQQRPLADYDGLAAYLNITHRHAEDLVYRRRIPFKKVGRLVRFDLDEIDAWLDANSVAAQVAL